MDSEPPKKEKAWREELDADSAGRVLAAIDEPEPELLANGEADLPAIDGYVLDRRIGGGGGGEVFRAVRTGSDRPLAVKLLNQHLGETPEARRAWRELDVLEQLRLPAVPRLLDYGVHEGRLYLVTEYIDGSPLVEYCEAYELSREERVELLAEVADAVQSLHERGVIHRDIKPGNVLVEETPGTVDDPARCRRPMLVDLGIATLLTGDVAETITAQGAPIGSPAYMAPEQARGEREAVSTRSDVYGLGAMAYVLLAGDTPHDMKATLHEAIRRVAQEPPRGPRELEPDLSKPLAAILAKAVAAKPADRYASPAEFAKDLRRWLDGETVEAGGLSLAQRFGRYLGRHPVTVTAAVCALFVALTIVASCGAVWWLNRRPYRIEKDPISESWVRLVSINGRILKEWDTGVEGGIRFAEIVESEIDGKKERILLIGFRHRIGIAEVDGDFCAFDVDDPATMLWHTGTGPPEIKMPPPISNVQGEKFRFSSAILEDIFPESPGKEVVTVHAHMPHSPYLIRVSALNGTVLYEAWHDGYLNEPYWMPEPGLLVFCGLSSEATWSDRGQPELPGARNPLVVFAIRPVFDQINEEWIHTPGGEGHIDPVWYRCVLPAENGQYIDILPSAYQVIGPNEYLPASSHVRLTISGGEPLYVSLGLTLDERGREVDRIVGDSFQTLPDLPGPDDFRLGDLPPIVGR